MAIRQIEPFPWSVRVAVTDRHGGASRGDYARQNLGDHVHDDPGDVVANRRRLARCLGRPIQWADQVHGETVVRCDAVGAPPVADGFVTDRDDLVLGILTADCFPVVLATESAAALLHCGWRGAASELIDNARGLLGEVPRAAWIGPGICPRCYEVDAAVWDRFDSVDRQAIRPGRDGHGFLDIAALIERRLEGVDSVLRDGRCTFEDANLYSHRLANLHSHRLANSDSHRLAISDSHRLANSDSHRRAAHVRPASPARGTGRFATLVWIDRAQ